jgi:hypothetical protein
MDLDLVLVFSPEPVRVVMHHAWIDAQPPVLGFGKALSRIDERAPARPIHGE